MREQLDLSVDKRGGALGAVDDDRKRRKGRRRRRIFLFFFFFFFFFFFAALDSDFLERRERGNGVKVARDGLGHIQLPGRPRVPPPPQQPAPVGVREHLAPCQKRRRVDDDDLGASGTVMVSW